jgi:hypothetical protein
MATDKIRFDSDYIREYAKTVAAAQNVVKEALVSLKKANRHDGWLCEERERINLDIEEISKKLTKTSETLGNLSSGMGECAVKFETLETRASGQEGQISAELLKNWGFEALKWIAGGVGKVISGVGNAIGSISQPKTSVPTLPIPNLKDPPKVTVNPPTSPGDTNLGKLLRPNLPWVIDAPNWLKNILLSLND